MVIEDGIGQVTGFSQQQMRLLLARDPSLRLP
jgi:hypothetical protein